MNVLRESKIAALIKGILLWLYSACAGSLIFKATTTVALWLYESMIYKAVIWCMEKISFLFKGSAIYKFIYRKSREREYMENSWLFSLAEKIILGVSGICSSAYLKIKALNTDSLNNRVYLSLRNGLSLSYENILGLIMIAIAVVPGSMWNNAYGLLLAAGAAFLFIIGVFSKKGYSLNLKGFGMAMLIFVFAACLAVVNSQNKPDSLRVFMFFATSFVFMGVIASSINTEDKLDKFIGFIYTGVIITSLICIAQVFIGMETDLLTVDTESSGDIIRAFSTFENPNNYAEYLVLFMPFMAAFALNRENKKERILYLFMLVIPIAALVLTYSRSCWVTFAIAAVLFVLLYDYRLFPYIIVAAIIVIPLIPESVTNRILTIGSMEDTSNSYRVDIWRGSLKMLKEWWISGTGLGPAAFGKIYARFSEYVAKDAMHSHMLFLEVFLEMGVIGGISFLFWWVSTIKRFFTLLIRKNLNGRKIKNIVIASISSLTALTFVSGVEYIWFYPRVMVMFFAAAGIMISAMNSQNHQH